MFNEAEAEAGVRDETERESLKLREKYGLGNVDYGIGRCKLKLKRA